MQIFLSLLFICFWNAAEASSEAHLPALGKHHKILVFEKNENPQNILVVYTRTTPDCRFTDPQNPVLDFYWLMNGNRYKPVHSLLKKGIRKRFFLQADQTAAGRAFVIKPVPEKKEKFGFENASLRVQSQRTIRGCEVTAHALSPQQEALSLEKISGVVEKSLWPPFRNLVSVTFSGHSHENGKPTQITFKKE